MNDGGEINEDCTTWFVFYFLFEYTNTLVEKIRLIEYIFEWLNLFFYQRDEVVTQFIYMRFVSVDVVCFFKTCTFSCAIYEDEFIYRHFRCGIHARVSFRLCINTLKMTFPFLSIFIWRYLWLMFRLMTDLVVTESSGIVAVGCLLIFYVKLF